MSRVAWQLNGTIMVIENVPALLRKARETRGLSLRAAAHEIGCGHATLRRIEEGEDMLVSNLMLVVLWLRENM